MSRKSFLTVAYASSITFDADQSKNFQVTLTGSPTITLAGGQEGDEIGILLIQGGSGSYTATWPSTVSFAAGQSPSLGTAVGATDLITLIKRGSTWQDKGGAPSKLPSRIVSAALGTIIGVGIASGGALMTTKLSGGSGTPSEITKVADNRQVIVGTGGSITMTIKEQGSGSLLLSSSGGNATGLGVGVANLKANSKITDANLRVNAEGELTGSSSTVSGTMSGRNLNLSGKVGSNLTATVRKIPCFKNGGDIGVMTVTATGGIATGSL